MVDEVQSSDLEDPLQDYSALYCISRTFRDLPGGPNSIDTNDLESIHSYFKTMALKNPNQLLDQAKAILDSGSELPNSEFPIGNEFLAEKDKENNPQERRPGLGRKKVLFSMKDYSSQPAPSLDLTLDVDKLGNPEEYFLAFEKREVAKKEYEIHGVLPDSHQDTVTSKTSRHRRAGLLGRPAKYKHRFSMLSEINQALASSEEPFAQNILSPSNHNSQQDISDLNIASQEMKLAGPVTKKEKLNEILDQFLSSQDLAGDGAISFMQECLQIKPIEVDKLSLPVVHDIRRDSFKASGGNLPKHRSSIPDLSLLKKHILQSKPLHDTFPDPNTEPSPVRSSFLAGGIDKQSDQVDMGKELSISGKLDPPILDENDTVVANTDLREVITEDSMSPFNKPVNVNLSRLDVDIDVHSSGSHGNVEDINGGHYRDDNSSRLDTDVSIPATIKHLAMDEPSRTPDIDPEHDVEKIKEPLRNEESKERRLSSQKVKKLSRKNEQSEERTILGQKINEQIPASKRPRKGLERNAHTPTQTLAIANIEDSTPFRKLVFDNLSRLDVDIDVHSIGSHGNVEDIIGESTMDDNSRRPETDASSPTSIKHHAIHEPSGTPNVAPEHDVEEIQEQSRNEESKERGLSTQKARKGSRKSEQSKDRTTPDVSGPATIKHLAMDEPSGTPNISPEHDVEKIQEPSRNEESKERRFSSQEVKKSLRKNEQSKEKTIRGQEVNEQSPASKRPLKGHKRNVHTSTQTRAVANNLSRLDVDIYVHSIGSHGIVEDTNGDSTMDDNSRRPETDASSPATIKRNVIDAPFGTPNVAPEHDVEEIQEPSMNEESSSQQVKKSLCKSEQSKDRTTPGQEVNDHSQANKRPRKSDQSKERTIPGQEVNEQGQANVCPRKSVQSKERTIPDQEVNGQSRAKKRHGCKRNVHNLTQTLADAGTHWESGVRRSTRITSKPLKYWKGERFLYGRVDENLVTVIGMKYASPTKGDKTPALKVKSYVSEKYKALVELAAMH